MSSGHCVTCQVDKSFKNARSPEGKLKKSLYCKANRSRIVKHERRTNANHPATRSLSNLQRRRSSSSPESFTSDELLKLREEQVLCKGCFQEFSEQLLSTLDHKVPLKLGGTDRIDNIQLLCRPCNSSKGAKPYDVWFKQKSNGVSSFAS